jgi:transcription elongation factor Elf1
MPAMRDSRWRVSQLGVRATSRARAARWRNRDLRGPLAPSVVRAPVTAIQSLPTRGPWPEVDEEAWWAEVLTDRRLRRSTAKKLSEKDNDARQRLDRLPARSLTFSCKWCGEVRPSQSLSSSKRSALIVTCGLSGATFSVAEPRARDVRAGLDRAMETRR